MMSKGEKRYIKGYRQDCRGWLRLDGLIRRQKDCCCLPTIRNGQPGLLRPNRIWKRPIMCKSTRWYETICCRHWRQACTALMARFCEPGAPLEFASAKRIRGLKWCWTKEKIDRSEGY